MAVPKKRKHSGEEKPPEKRQKNTIEALNSKFTEPVDAEAAITTAKKFTKPEQSITSLVRLRETKATRVIHGNTTSRIRLHDTKTKPNKVIVATHPGGDKIENQDHGFKDLIAKAQEKVQEKRQIDHHNTCIASQRIAARLALNQMVKTVDFDDHLKYHTELEKLGCDFIRDQVSCLNMFDLLSRSTYYIDESNSVLEKTEIPRSGEYIQ